MQDRDTRTNFEEEYVSTVLKNQAANYSRQLFEGIRDADRKNYLRTLGDTLIISEKLLVQLKIEFPWEEIRAFTTQQIKDAAKKAGLTIYDIHHPSPYADIKPEADVYAIVEFENDPESAAQSEGKIKAQIPFWDAIKNVWQTGRRPLLTPYSAIYIRDNEVVVPQLSFKITTPNIISVKVIGLRESPYNKTGSYQNIIDKTAQELGYSFTDFELSQPIEAIEEANMHPSEKSQYISLRSMLFNKANGAYYLASELD